MEGKKEKRILQVPRWDQINKNFWLYKGDYIDSNFRSSIPEFLWRGLHDTIGDTYLSAELAIPRHGYEYPQNARAIKCRKDQEGNPVGTANNNLILDTCEYIIDVMDGYEETMTVNLIAEYLFSQVEDVWLWPATTKDGFGHYEYILVYVDDYMFLKISLRGWRNEGKI